ncbi:MAG: alpha/beta hydrolase [Acidimicrobiales bacterium]|nr:alpha/beta hydrolase [Acidimicrobiales bacterium]
MPEAETITLPDGRALCFDDVGDPAGKALLYVHGTPDSRRARHPDDGLARDLGVRLIAADRPGAGASDPHPGGTVGSFGDDAAALAAHLGIERWAVLAWSAGSLFGLGHAARHAQLVRRLGIVGGLPPFPAYGEPGVLDGADGNRHMVAELGAELGAAAFADLLAPMVAPYPCDHALAVEHLLEGRDAVARAELDAVPGAIDAMADGIVDAVAGGLAGLTRDLALQVEPLDVDLADVRAPVRLWHGTEDHTAPPSFGRWLADHLPDATLDVVDGAGHCLLLPRWAEILTALVAD